MRFARHHLLARIGPGLLQVSESSRRRPVWVLEQPFASLDELQTALTDLREPVREHHLPRQVLVRVQPPLLQRRILTDLPPVRQTELTQLVSQSSGRYFRQNGHPLVSAAQWEGAGQPPRRVARAVALDSDLSEAIVDGVRRAGLGLEDIVPDGGPSSLSLLPAGERARRRERDWRGLFRLGAAVALLWLAVGVYVTVRLRVESEQLTSELIRLKEPREALARAGTALHEASAMLAAIDYAEVSRNQLAGRLDQLIRALPDSVVLSSLTLDTSGTALVSGRTRQVSHLMAVLEGAPFWRVRLEGQISRDTLNGIDWERFSLRLQANGRP